MKKNDEMTKVMKKDTKKSEDKDGETDTEMVLESDREENMDTGGTERSQTDESLEGKRRTRLVKKRKVDQEPELSPVQSGAMDAFLAEVEKLCKEVELIKELSEKNANTKIKIKEKARYVVKMTKKVATLRLKINQKAPPVPFNYEKVPDTPKTSLGVLPIFGTTTLPGPTYCQRCKDEIGKEERTRKELERAENMEDEQLK